MFDISYAEVEYLPEWYRLAEVKEPNGIKFHIFRHTFAMRELNKGTRIEEISAMMGHESIDTTKIYAKLFAKTKRDAMHRVTLE
jgi:integrase/recombinase XerD